MNEQTARELMMDALYGEISKVNKEKLGQYLQTHPELQQELEELQAVHELLQEAPDLKTDEKLFPVESRNRSFLEWKSQAGELLPRSAWAKTMVAAAACLLLAFIGFSAANLNIHSTENGFLFHLGYGQKVMKNQTDIVQTQTKPVKSKPQQVGLTKKQVETIVQKMQKRNTRMLAKYAQKLSENNQQQLQQVVNYFKQKRQKNLKLFQTALNHYQTQLDQYQQKTNYNLIKTHQVMGKMARVIEVSTNQ